MTRPPVFGVLIFRRKQTRVIGETRGRVGAIPAYYRTYVAGFVYAFLF